MGRRNYLIDGVSCAGKTSVCHALRQLGYDAVNGDQELAYQGDPETGKSVDQTAIEDQRLNAVWVHDHHIWDIAKLKSIMSDRSADISFFCGGSRNGSQFIDLFDAVFVLEIDLKTLSQRLADRPADEFGGKAHERELIFQLHASKRDIPNIGISIDATRSLPEVVDEILARCNEVC